ncbi:cupin domain-containing protein [Actinokineospora sp. PR83]|uniref:cupin domain-containing protein n=1 Tax=Actinokineospora sp. PR83 TaxID=2884908 RepID=UPI0027DEBF42|nr:cupin domain-containing protein [Actinokineospora sp. PR83]MCG8920196.1 cupin domain-containing protein [Actinokineospora sp. PR83]
MPHETRPPRTSAPALNIVTWADAELDDDRTTLRVGHGPLPSAMHGAVGATGRELATIGAIGADLIRLPAGSGFQPHTHPGHHVLTVVGGIGTITYGGKVYETNAGQTYLIEGDVPHAVGAITDHVILAVGSPHMPVDHENRMAPVPYEEVIAPDGDLTCLICAVTALAPTKLHAEGCPHCPCATCVGVAP